MTGICMEFSGGQYNSHVNDDNLAGIHHTVR